MASLSSELRDGLKTDPLTMTFGPGGFFAYAPCTRSSLEPSDEDHDKYIMWWSNYEVYPAPDRNTSLADIHAQLTQRYGFWKLPYDTPRGAVYPSIIDQACRINVDEQSITWSPTAVKKNVLVHPRCITPRLPRWCSSSGRIILIGDAAHAMLPNFGQGVSCAVEDSLAIGVLLKYHLTFGKTSAEEPDIADALKKTKTAYEAVRMPRVQSILNHAKNVGDRKRKKTWFQEKVRDWMIWTICEYSSVHFNFALMTRSRPSSGVP
jgi:2-polyprenyl-6-methoxyphenol hydroxylase-like FAD-dependent oxidoreductase